MKKSFIRFVSELFLPPVSATGQWDVEVASGVELRSKVAAVVGRVIAVAAAFVAALSFDAVYLLSML